MLALIAKNKLSKQGIIFALKQQILASVIMLICCLFTYISWGADYALSAFLGAIVIILPNIVFAIKTFQYSGARFAKKVVESFYSGEKIKMVLTVLLVAVVFRFVDVIAVPFFISFSLIVAVPLFTPFIFKH